MILKPLQDRVIVKRIESVKTTSLGIIIPDNAAEKPDQGEVIAIGPGKYHPTKGDLIPVNVSEGDIVLFGKHSGQTVKLDGIEYLVLREDELFAIIKK